MSGALILPSGPPGLVLGARTAQPKSLFRVTAPAIITRRFGRAPQPPDASGMQVEIHRQPLRVALDWQLQAVQIRREHPRFGMDFRQAMDEAGLGRRPLVLVSLDGGPRRFNFIGETQRRFFGDAWADSQLGKPQMSSGYDALTRALDAEYQEAILGGEPVHNRVVMHGLAGAPVIYSHTLFGWDQGDIRIVVAMVDY